VKVNGKELSEHPVSALEELANWGCIPRPRYAGQPLNPNGSPYALVATVDGYGFAEAVAETKQDAKREAAQKLLDKIERHMCPHPGRPRYATWEAAYDAMMRQQITGKGKPLRQVYACRCTWWHISGSKPRDED
jgi:hypothetical protein